MPGWHDIRISKRGKKAIAYYVENGFIAYEKEGLRFTKWNYEGKVAFQINEHGLVIHSPPWSFDVQDQIKPTAP